MEGRRLKKSVVYGIYSVAFVAVIGVIYLIESSIQAPKLEEDNVYVTGTIFDQSVPVLAETDKIIRPYTDEGITILKKYYDYKADEDSQENSIIVYNNTYMQSSGVCYGGKDNFNVVAILDGEVIDIKDDELLGKVVEIRHTNNIISYYQSLSDVAVTKNQKIKAGEIIGTSGTSNLNKDLGSHLYFELIVNGTTVNPEDYYNKQVNEL